jgi:hypothetical protein
LIYGESTLANYDEFGKPTGMCDYCSKPAKFYAVDGKYKLCQEDFEIAYGKPKANDDAEVEAQTRKWQEYFGSETGPTARVDFSSWNYDPEISTVWCDGKESVLTLQQRVGGE